MRESDFRRARSLLGSELRMFKIELVEVGLDEDTQEIVVERVNGLITELEGVSSEGSLDRIESDLGKLQIVVRQALKRVSR